MYFPIVHFRWQMQLSNNKSCLQCGCTVATLATGAERSCYNLSLEVTSWPGQCIVSYRFHSTGLGLWKQCSPPPTHTPTHPHTHTEISWKTTTTTTTENVVWNMENVVLILLVILANHSFLPQVYPLIAWEKLVLGYTLFPPCMNFQRSKLVSTKMKLAVVKPVQQLSHSQNESLDWLGTGFSELWTHEKYSTGISAIITLKVFGFVIYGLTKICQAAETPGSYGGRRTFFYQIKVKFCFILVQILKASWTLIVP